jgi:tetratricopeptide (TPR) repeat protein
MKRSIRSFLAALFVASAIAAGVHEVRADDTNPELAAAIHQLETDWERIKFTQAPSAKQLEEMNALGVQADALAGRFPDQAPALIWDGIILSERASMSNEVGGITGPLSALKLAKSAKAVLEKAYAMDASALDAGAATSLGVLYYRVPSFPIGFGDTAKARKLLEQAVSLAPQGLDAQYFYGDFLVTQKQIPEAKAVLENALTIPANPDRPIWDNNRRLVIQQLLKKISAPVQG